MNRMVSIITPSYNTAKFISQTIESVQAQSYENWEMIIVDDCSTDNTDEIVQPYLSDFRIHYYKNAINSGAAASRNFALRQAKGRWIAFLDSDDLWEENKLEKQVRFMSENGLHFSYTSYQEMDEDGHALGIYVTGPKKISRRGMMHYCYPGCLTVMYDAEYIGLIQINNIKKNNDYAMWLEICQRAACWHLDECLARYRKRSGSISRHGILTMVSWHYKLWHEAEKKTKVASVWYAGWNLFFGLRKKIRFVKKRKQTSAY